MKKQFNPKTYANFVNLHRESRKKAQGNKFSEIDFLAGAMCAFFYFQQQEKLPAEWVFGGGK